MTEQATLEPGRRELHTRTVSCVAWLRDDGLIDLDGRIVDVKPHAVELIERFVAANEPFHLMRLRLTVDMDFVIHEVVAHTEKSPRPNCADITPVYSMLRGLKIGPGFRKEVSARVGGIKGCTHLTDLLFPMATTLIQSTFDIKREAMRQRMAADPSYVPPPSPFGNDCHVGAPPMKATLLRKARTQTD